MKQDITSFRGLDLRREVQSADPRTLATAVNVRLTSGATLRTRPGTRRIVTLPVGCVGLYSDGARLRSVAPAGYADIDAEAGGVVTLDRIGDSTLYPRDSLTFLAAELWEGQPYVAVRRAGVVEHHFIQALPSGPGALVNTRVALPFIPGDALIKLAGKLWATESAQGKVRFSSTQFGPLDWLAPSDAGFLPVGKHAPAATFPTGLGVYRGRLAVQFADSTQIWAVDPDPANHGLDPDNGVLNGAGTVTPSLTVNVLGDMYYFSVGGFRSLAAGENNALAQEGDIGAPIYELTRALDPAAADAAVWWQALGTYCAAFDGRIYAFLFDRAAGVAGWTTWELPFQVRDLATLGGRLYALGDDRGVYEFDPERSDDDGTAVAFDVRTQHAYGGTRAAVGMKMWDAVTLRQSGDCELSYFPEPRDPSIEVRAGRVSGLRQPFHRVMTPGMSDGIALRFKGAGQWQLDGFTIDFRPTGT